MKGIIFDIKEMAVHDGPGIRTTVFFKGCPLRCRWCHNPEGLSYEPQLMFKDARCINCKSCRRKCDHDDCQPFGRCIHACPENCLEITGRRVESADLAKELRESAYLLGNSFGGFTFSGGEPLAQPRFLLALLEELKDYKDSATQLNRCKYDYASHLYRNDQTFEAATLLYSIKDYQDAKEKSLDIWQKHAQLPTIDAGELHIVALTSSGKGISSMSLTDGCITP